MANGSFFCISSGGPRSALVASSRQSGKKASRRSSSRVWLCSDEISSLPRNWLARLPVMPGDDGGGVGGDSDERGACDDDGCGW